MLRYTACAGQGKALYSVIASEYPEAPLMSEAEYARFHKLRAAMMQALLEQHLLPPVSRVLDIGGGANVLGTGAFIKKHWGARIDVIDLGADGARYEGDELAFHQVNVDREALPFENGAFDLVLFASIIEHLYNPAFALAECARVLRHGGHLLVEAPNAVSLARRIDALKGRNPFRFFNTYNTRNEKPPMLYCSVFYTMEEVEALLSPSFDVIDRRYGRHVPQLAGWKKLIREAAIRVSPSLSDCFALMARRAAPDLTAPPHAHP